MQRTLRDLKTKDAIRAFRRAGGEPRTGKGDHVNLKMPNGRIITLRTTGEVKIGRLRDALREAGMTPDEFSVLLQ